jgi:hypothetical protein
VVLEQQVKVALVAMVVLFLVTTHLVVVVVLAQ